MREDIQIHNESGDIQLSPTDTYNLAGEVRWVDNPEGLQGSAYCEIEINHVVQEAKLMREGVFVHIPYHPVYKTFRVRFKRLQDNGSYAFLTNPVDGTEWFLVVAGLHGANPTPIHASELMLISNQDFYLRFENENVVIYSAVTVDMNIVNSGNQNSNMLLSCVPGNNYRYPVSGVGLVRWINGPMTSEEIARVINNEFAEDGVAVTSASFNSVTKRLQLISNASKVD